MLEILTGLLGLSVGFSVAGLVLHSRFSKYNAEVEQQYEKKIVNLEANHSLAMEIAKNEAKENAELRIREFQEAFNRGYETRNERPAFVLDSGETGSGYVSDEELYFQELEEMRKANAGLIPEDDGLEERAHHYY